MTKRTPYDTGKRSEPKPWHVQPRNLPDPEELDRYGKVDFEDDAGGTLATLYIEKDDDDSWVLRGYAWESLRLEVESNDPTDPDLTITVPGMVDKEELREMVQTALNSGKGDTEWATLVDLGGILGLEFDEEKGTYQ